MAFAVRSFCTCREAPSSLTFAQGLKIGRNKSASSALSACLTVQFPVQSFNSRASSPRRIWNSHLARSSGRAEERAGVQICICGAISYFALVPPRTQNRTKRVCEGSSLLATPQQAFSDKARNIKESEDGSRVSERPPPFPLGRSRASP